MTIEPQSNLFMTVRLNRYEQTTYLTPVLYPVCHGGCFTFRYGHDFEYP